jgi:hypothetical protein
MIINTSRKLIQKFIILAMLLVSLGLISGSETKKASACEKNSLIPCCSYCDEHFGDPICAHGCSDSCRAGH